MSFFFNKKKPRREDARIEHLRDKYIFESLDEVRRLTAARGSISTTPAARTIRSEARLQGRIT
jgi:hypothetical protein